MHSGLTKLYNFFHNHKFATFALKQKFIHQKKKKNHMSINGRKEHYANFIKCYPVYTNHNSHINI